MAGLAAPALAQDSRFGCDDERRSDSGRRHCEIREYTVPATGAMLTIDATPNGGIAVRGGSRSDVLVRAKVVANAETDAEARQIAAAVQVRASADRVDAQGPSSLPRRQGWQVSYEVLVPTQTYLSLRSANGGLAISDVEGEIDFRTVNGGVSLRNLAGQVRGRTTNGGVNVVLDGATWVGPGLDVETQNGGVSLAVPDGYSARLEARTVNGGMRVDFPMTVQGRIDRSVEGDLGSGGPPVRVRTTNGGVKVTRR